MKSAAPIIDVGVAWRLLAGCTVGPDYHAPETATPAQWSSPLAGGETNGAGRRTRPGGKPSTTGTGFAHHPRRSIQSRPARRRRPRARGPRRPRRGCRRILAQRWTPPPPTSANALSANGFPAVSARHSAGRGTSIRRALMPRGNWMFSAARAARSRPPTPAIAAAEFGRRDVLVSLHGEVARNYVEARGFQRRLAIARENIAGATGRAQLTRDRFKPGLTGELDVRAGRALCWPPRRPKCRRWKPVSASRAYRLGGVARPAARRIVGGIVRRRAHPRRRRPPCPSVCLRNCCAGGRTSAAPNAISPPPTPASASPPPICIPKFSLTGDIGLQSVGASDWFNGGSRFWSAGPTVQWRIFDAGRIRANIRVQNARQEQALAGYEQAVLSAMEDVENALTAYAKEQIRHESLADAVARRAAGGGHFRPALSKRAGGFSERAGSPALALCQPGCPRSKRPRRSRWISSRSTRPSAAVGKISATGP